MLVLIPGIGPVLVWEGFGMIWVDIVAENAAAAAASKAELVETELRYQTPGLALRFSWAKSASIPVAFR